MPYMKINSNFIGAREEEKEGISAIERIRGQWTWSKYCRILI